MTQTITWDDPRLSWYGLVSLKATDQGAQPWRLPQEALGLFPPPGLAERAAMPAGVRLSFFSNTTSLSGEITTSPETSSIDLCCNGAEVASIDIAGRDTFNFTELPSGKKLIELWLPQFGQFFLRDLKIDDDATLSPYEDERPRWITYGSSITHCRDAASPTHTWPAIVARQSGLNLTCLGYGGNCHLEPMVARMIRDLPADYLSACAGINIQGGSSLSPRTLQSALIGFVQIVRERHPKTPFAVISPICSPPREAVPNAVGFDLRRIRVEVAAAVEALQRHGDDNLFYVDGLQLFGPEYSDYLPDQLHPNAQGYKILARNFLKDVAPLLFNTLH